MSGGIGGPGSSPGSPRQLDIDDASADQLATAKRQEDEVRLDVGNIEPGEDKLLDEVESAAMEYLLSLISGHGKPRSASRS